MYDTHVPVISAAMRADAETFARGCMFAILSIRQPIRNVPAMLDDLDRERSNSRFLMGYKRAAYHHITLNAARLQEAVLGAAGPCEAILALCETPGLGIVKAGFICQLAGLDVACLDSRNVTREGRRPREFRTDGKSPQTRAFKRKVERYVGETGGRAREYWDAWCNYVAPFHNLTPHAVSELHLAIVPDTFIPF